MLEEKPISTSKDVALVNLSVKEVFMEELNQQVLESTMLSENASTKRHSWIKLTSRNLESQVKHSLSKVLVTSGTGLLNS